PVTPAKDDVVHRVKGALGLAALLTVFEAALDGCGRVGARAAAPAISLAVGAEHEYPMRSKQLVGLVGTLGIGAELCRCRRRSDHGGKGRHRADRLQPHLDVTWVP